MKNATPNTQKTTPTRRKKAIEISINKAIFQQIRKSIKIKIDKELLEECIARFIYNSIIFITLTALISLVVAIAIMIEKLAITKELLIICGICILWFGLCAIIRKLTSKKK
jgi:hypothetical protein